MARKHDTYDTYYIPHNYIDSSSVFGGAVKTRNLAEGIIMAMIPSYFIYNSATLDLTWKVILILICGLPLLLLGCIGLFGEPPTQFSVTFYRFLRNRHIYRYTVPDKEDTEEQNQVAALGVLQDQLKATNDKSEKRRLRFEIKELRRELTALRKDRLDAERQRLRDFEERNKKAIRSAKAAYKNACAQARINGEKIDKKQLYKECMHAAQVLPKAPRAEARTPVRNYTQSRNPIERISRGVIITKDGRYVKVMELEPINFSLRSASEQRDVIFSFMQMFKVGPDQLQFKVISDKADIDGFIEKITLDMSLETNEKCKELAEDYIELIRSIGSKGAVSRRFFIIFQYEQEDGNRKPSFDEILYWLDNMATSLRAYLTRCGNNIIDRSEEESNTFLMQLLFDVERYNTAGLTFQQKVDHIYDLHIEKERDELETVDFVSPLEVDLRHQKYVKVDGVYFSYLMIPSDGFKDHVTAAWLSALVNSGEGIDVDVFFARQPKDRIQAKIGQQLRMNKSKMRDTDDTNKDFDSLSGSIQSGYYLKDGIANGEDLYYMNILVSVAAHSKDALFKRVKQLIRHISAQDIDLRTASFLHESGRISALPLCKMDPKLYELSKRNVLTSSAASTYLFASYEMFAEDGILLGQAIANNSLVGANLFDTSKNKNSSVSIIGTSGSGKTYVLQCIGTRLRLKGVQTFVLAPLKGFEYKRACDAMSGAYIKIGAGSEYSINVMEIRKQDTSASDLLDGVSNTSLLSRKIEDLRAFFYLICPDLTLEEEEVLDSCLLKTYERKGITTDNDSLWDPERPGHFKTMPVLVDLYNELQNDKDSGRLALIMRRYATGSAKSFSRQTNVDLSNKYVVLDISELNDRLLPIGMFICIDYAWSKVREDRTVPKALILDELWRLISQNEIAANYCLEIFKTARAYGCAAINATQDLVDYFSLAGGRYGKAILNNSRTKIIMGLEPQELDLVVETLGLTEAETYNVRHFNRGQGLVMMSGNNIAVQFVASEREDALFTTDPQKLRKIYESIREQAG